MRHRINKTCYGLAILIITVSLTVPASATFPGKNGRIAFVIGADVYSMNSDGSDVKQLTNVGDENGTFYPSWSPDGRQIVFNEFFPDVPSQLWLMNSDGSSQRKLLVNPDFFLLMPSFSPDGKAVVFTRCRLDFEECNIAHLVIDTGEVTFITPITRGIEDQYPKYSPDGKSITFSALSREGVVFAVYRLDLNNTVPVRLTPPVLAGAYSDWSPDGSKIAFASHQVSPEDPHNQEIIQIDAGGTNLTRLTFNGNDYFANPHDFQPSWSPQGDAIVFERDAPDFSSGAIYLLKMDGSTPAKILTIPKAHAHLAQRPKTHPGTRGKNTLEQIEDGGLGPSWGPAQQ